ncbi:uncharacterized protein LOC126996276 [Eriocheir sinensis]|uniref:uncharacterized protein LOC126996276 n=1 Tax=Eriocheir sinensis TaxID=95602 RepID=UPI0021CA092E|nr:uncharacterized protein LOC126996276 [Eriocheir sinensis]
MSVLSLFRNTSSAAGEVVTLRDCLYSGGGGDGGGEGFSHASWAVISTCDGLDVCAEIWCVNGPKLRSPGASALDGTRCGRNANRKQVKGSKKNVKKPRRVLGRSGRRNPLPNISKIESPTHLIIKERMNYVEGKGWKMHILKIQTTKLSNRRVTVKKYTIKCAA